MATTWRSLDPYQCRPALDFLAFRKALRTMPGEEENMLTWSLLLGTLVALLVAETGGSSVQA